MANAALRLCCGTKVGFPHSELCGESTAVKPSVETAVNGHPSFLAILDEIKALHCRKAADYGSGNDPLANMRSDDFGVPAYVNAILQCKNKLKRLQAFCVNGKLANEGVEDSFLDLAAYAIIGLVLYRESQHGR